MQGHGSSLVQMSAVSYSFFLIPAEYRFQIGALAKTPVGPVWMLLVWLLP